MKKTHAAVTGKGSSLTKYQDVVVGSRLLLDLFYYELCMFLAPVPGALGMMLRKIFWPRLFKSCGEGCMFGSGIIVRHPGRIRLGNSVIISEGCILDARHESMDTAIDLKDNVILSNSVMLSCKNGSIKISSNVGINAQTIIQSTNNCPVAIGKDCVIGQRCFIIGGGNYHIDRTDIPIRQQGIKNDGGVCLENDVWLGGNVTVLGGVTMSKGSVAAAGAVLTKSIPEKALCAGIPAQIYKIRGE